MGKVSTKGDQRIDVVFTSSITYSSFTTRDIPRKIKRQEANQRHHHLLFSVPISIKGAHICSPCQHAEPNAASYEVRIGPGSVISAVGT